MSYLLLSDIELQRLTVPGPSGQAVAKAQHAKILAELKMIRDGEEYALSFRQAIEAMIQRMERE